jgi:hypothetical protein
MYWRHYKKSILLFTVFLITQALFAQQKYALVIGNGNYTGLSKLGNPVNDANDMTAAGNELNVVVLDACRDNPFAWARSGSRGLTVISNQPADSIVVYATSASSTAADGTGRNGLFTAQLLKNIKTPGLEVTELFRRTGADVAQASDRKQIPAVYSQFFGNAYLGSEPVATAPVLPTPAPQPVTTVQPAAVPETPAQYRIGDRGPAGGIIFYDKGNNSDGWRYLEAGPVDLQNAAWVADRKSVAGTGTGIGSGKRNTELTIAALGDSGKAAQLCKAYTQGWYSDWFLPSKDELDLMYKNLKQNNLGGFWSVWYWSSSQFDHYDNDAWGQSFVNGNQYGDLKNHTASVRAVRAF